MAFILDLIFPKTCYGCGCTGTYLCQGCFSLLTYSSIKKPAGFAGIVSLFRYRGPIKKIISGLKYNFVSDLTNTLSELSVATIKTRFPNVLAYWQENKFVFTSVPLHVFRENWRGFNQSEIVGRQVAKSLGLVYKSIFIKPFSTLPQATLKKSLRKQNIFGVFRIRDIQLPKKLIIFDDVTTTNSTLKSLRPLLPKSSEVWGLTIAG